MASSDWRRRKAQSQLRDRFGRWVSLGANVRWKAEGQDLSGTVKRFEGEHAIVEVKRPDGTTREAKILPSSLRVLASKATLPKDENRFYDAHNNTASKIKDPEVLEAFEESGDVAITREDGYMLTMKEKRPKETGNPILYQLFAPGGISLGIYNADATGSFDAMISDHKAGGTGVVASGKAKPYRVPEAVQTEIASALAANPDISVPDYIVATRLANESVVSLDDVEWVANYFSSTEAEEKVRGGYKGKKWASKIVTPLTEEEMLLPEEEGEEEDTRYDFDDRTFSYFAIGQNEFSTEAQDLLCVDYDTDAVYRWTENGFAYDPSVYASDIDEPMIMPIDTETAEAMARWMDSKEGETFNLLSVDPEERNLFTLAEGELDFEELDRASAIIADATGYTPLERSVNAKQQRRGPGGKFGEEPDEAPIEEARPKEVKARLPIELPLVQDVPARIQDFIANEAKEAPVMAAAEVEEGAPEGGYTEEDKAIEDSATGPQGEAMYFGVVDDVDKSAVLDVLAIVKSNGQPQVWQRSGGQWVISEDYLTNLTGTTPPPVVEIDDPETVKDVLAQVDSHDAEKAPAEEEAPAQEAPMAASAASVGEGKTFFCHTEPSNVSQNDIWFDRSNNNRPMQWDGSEWIPLQGTAITASVSSSEAASAGYSLPDGSLPIFDSVGLLRAVLASADTNDAFVKNHIRRRALALNRMDLIPADWRTLSHVEQGMVASASGILYGEFGEIITAAGVPGVADTPSDFASVRRLKNYWTRGRGAAKIRWGTPGDLGRAHRHLVKYLGPRTWGFVQNLHKELFGVPNITRDRAVGHYKPRKKKR